MQIPYPFGDSEKSHFLKDLNKEVLGSQGYYVSFNSGLRELKRSAIR